MPTETYKYFIPESSNLRSEYGGGAIINGGDSAELDALTLTTRHICRQLDLPSNSTHYLFQAGSDGANNWLRVSDNLYPAISAFLSASEQASVVSTQPSGFTRRSNVPIFQPKSRKKNLFIIGDSLSAGVSAANGLSDALGKQALDAIEPTIQSRGEPEERAWENSSWAMCNLSLGAASWGNTNAAGGSTAYPQRFDLSYNQRIRTLALNGDAELYVHTWLGTNDIAYDSDLSVADIWARTENNINQLKTEFPNLQIILGTLIRRSESNTLNTRIDAYNVLLRANYQNIGVNHLVDYETAHPSFNVLNGNTNDTNLYAGDGVHLTTQGYSTCASVLNNLLVTL